MRALALTLMLAMTVPAYAVQPDEILPDPVLEQRAREISKVLKCPVCAGETIDDSNAPISRDLRIYLRERLVGGDSDQQAVQAIVDRFGEEVLFQPPFSGVNRILYLAGPIMALLGLLIGWQFLRTRSRSSESPSVKLSQDEQKRLDEIMRD